MLFGFTPSCRHPSSIFGHWVGESGAQDYFHNIIVVVGVYCRCMPEQALECFPLSSGSVVEDKPAELCVNALIYFLPLHQCKLTVCVLQDFEHLRFHEILGRHFIEGNIVLFFMQ